MNDARQRLIDGFLASAAEHPDRLALEVEQSRLTYRELSHAAHSIAADIQACGPSVGKLCGVLSGLNKTSYAGMLGALLAGRGFVPLNPGQPVDRLVNIIRRANLKVLVVGEDAAPLIGAILEACPGVGALIAPYAADEFTKLARLRSGPRVFLGCERATAWLPIDRDEVRADAIAYVMFTSGSTGEPKGVPVSNGNVVAYLENVKGLVQPRDAERFAQCSDLTFDLSIHPVWLCWDVGATLCVVPDGLKMAPAKFIKDKAITVWTSVPSVVSFLKRLRLLPPGAFPTIRYSMFCGEPLTAEQATAWQSACPNSTVDNYYGPTEATVAITYLRCERPLPASAAPNGVVSIGVPFGGQRVALVDEDLNPVPQGEAGEMLLSGSQVTVRYLDDPAQTEAKYVRVPALGSAIWYRTGDLARADTNGCLYFVGRADLQVKILGFRVELQEIEAVVREGSRCESVACVPWPIERGTAAGVHCFVAKTERAAPEVEILSACRARLPSYMVPQRIHMLPELPLSANGKIDRKKLAALLDAGQ